MSQSNNLVAICLNKRACDPDEPCLVLPLNRPFSAHNNVKQNAEHQLAPTNVSNVPRAGSEPHCPASPSKDPPCWEHFQSYSFNTSRWKPSSVMTPASSQLAATVHHQNNVQSELQFALQPLTSGPLSRPKVALGGRLMRPFPRVSSGLAVRAVSVAALRGRVHRFFRGWDPWLSSGPELQRGSGRVRGRLCRGVWSASPRRLGRVDDVPGRVDHQLMQEAPLESETSTLGAGDVQFLSGHHRNPVGLRADHVAAALGITPRMYVCHRLVFCPDFTVFVAFYDDLV